MPSILDFTRFMNAGQPGAARTGKSHPKFTKKYMSAAKRKSRRKMAKMSRRRNRRAA